LLEDGGELVPLASAGLSLLFLKFSRDDEYQADTLGVRYAARSGYELSEMLEVFRTLDRLSERGDGGALPEWLATHPSPKNRVDHVRAEIAEAGEADRAGEIDRRQYLHHIDGLVYGQDPRNGFFRGDRFIHPRLRFTVALPSEWERANYSEAVVAASPANDAAVQLTVSKHDDPKAALSQFAAQPAVRIGEPADLTPELPSSSASASFAAETEQGVLAGLVTYVALGEHTFELLAFAPAERLEPHLETFQRIHASFQPLVDERLAAVQPARIEVLAVPSSMPLRELYERRPASVPLEEIALLNQMQPDTRLHDEQLVKWVRGGEPLP
jgi:predicted Zn-dependent protease